MTRHCKICGNELKNIPVSCIYDNWQCGSCFNRTVVREARPTLRMTDYQIDRAGDGSLMGNTAMNPRRKAS